MNWRTTAWLALVTAALGLFILVVERPSRRAREIAQEPPRLFADLKAEDVGTLVVKFTTNTVALVRTNGLWELQQPQRHPASKVLVESFIRELRGLQGRSVLTTAELRSRPEAPAEFGLNPPTATVTLGTETGRLELLLGFRSVRGGEVYYQVAGVPGIFIADAALIDRLPRDADGWRDTALLPLDRIEFDRFRVSGAGGSFSLARTGADRGWELVEPRTARADPERVGVLLRQLGFLQILGFVAPTSAPPPEASGLRPPRLTLSLARGSNDVFRLALGGAISNVPAVYGQRAGETDLLQIPADAMDLLRIPYQELLDRRLLHFDAAAVREVVVEGPERFQVTYRTNRWEIQPGGIPAEGQAVNRLIAQLTSLESAEIAKEVVTVVDLPNYGLAPPALRLTLRATPGDTNSNLGVLETGAALENRVYARVPGEQPVYTLYPPDAAELPRASWNLRDRTLWSFHAPRVSAISVRHDGLDWAVRRMGTNDWSVPPGWRHTVNPFALEEALVQLGTARVLRIVGEGDVPRLGTTNGPQVQIEFRATPPANPLRLSFGKTSPAGNRYGALTTPDGARLTFELAGPLFDNLWSEVGVSGDASGP